MSDMQRFKDFVGITWLGVGDSVPKPLIPVLAMFKIPRERKGVNFFNIPY